MNLYQGCQKVMLHVQYDWWILMLFIVLCLSPHPWLTSVKLWSFKDVFCRLLKFKVQLGHDLNILISPEFTVTSSFGSQTWAHSGGGSRVHFFVPFIWACQEGFPTASIWSKNKGKYYWYLLSSLISDSLSFGDCPSHFSSIM